MSTLAEESFAAAPAVSQAWRAPDRRVRGRAGRRLAKNAAGRRLAKNAALQATFRLPTPCIALSLNHCGIGLRCTSFCARKLGWIMRWAAVALLACAAAASSSNDEVQSMLGALLESMSFAISQLYADRYDFLRTRAWYGNSHIGNRPIQARAYYDLARSVQPGTICEVGFNGGHSAAVFLSAAGRRAKMVSFDLAEFESVHKSNCRGASPRHRRDASSMAWRCAPDSLVDLCTGSSTPRRRSSSSGPSPRTSSG